MNKLASVSSEIISETELFSFLIQYALQHNFTFALWRLPDAPVKYFVLANTYQRISKETVLEDLHPGFIFAPYNPNEEAIYLPADYLFKVENGKLKHPENATEFSTAEWLKKQMREPLKNSNPKKYSEDKISERPQDYLTLVNRCINEIASGTMEKVVPSRTKTVTLPENFDALTAFEKLCDKYSHALISYVRVPEQEAGSELPQNYWLLLKIKQFFKTVALAGTLPYQEGVNLKSVAWTQKEIEEQALVGRYIISCFKKIRLREYEEHGPKTVVAGNLMHLKSDFTVDMRVANFSQLGTVMLQLLHPTSAVCGMPLNAALEFLKQHEEYDRSFYSGYLGPINIDNNINIFVNIRCMQLQRDHAILYAGAGVTIDSIPEKEFEETEMKFETLLNVIF